MSATHVEPTHSPLPIPPHTPAPIASTSTSVTHPHPDNNVYPNAKPTPNRRRSARLSISTPLPEWAAASTSSTDTSSPAPVQQAQVAVPFPSDSSSSVPSTPNANGAPSRARIRKRPRPSESGEVARRAVAALVSPSRTKSQSPMREDGVALKAGKAGERGSEKKRRKVSPVRRGQRQQQQQDVEEAMDVEAPVPAVVAKRVRTRSSVGTVSVEASTSEQAPTPSTSTVPVRATAATPTRPNHRKRKSMSALDDIRRDLGFPAAGEQSVTPQMRKKAKRSEGVEGEGVDGAKVSFAVERVGKGKGREMSPTRGKRATRSAKTPATFKADVPVQDVDMVEAPPTPTPEPAPKLRTRKSARKSVTHESLATALEPVSSPPATPAPHTPLGAAAAMLASTSNAATLPPSALVLPSSSSHNALISPASSPSALVSPASSPTAPARRFTRSSLSINTQDPVVAVSQTSPLSSTSQLSPLSPPPSPLASTSALPLSPNQVASAQTQSKAPAKLVEDAVAAASSVSGSGSGRPGAAPVRRIATRSSGLPLIVAEWGVAAGSGRRRVRPGSPLASVGSTVPESPEKEEGGGIEQAGVDVNVKGKEKEQDVGASGVKGKGKGKGKAGRKRVTVKVGPARRSSRLSGVEPPQTELGSTPVGQPGPQQLLTPLASPSPAQLQPQPQQQQQQQQPSHTPPSSPPSPPPLRLSLASLSPSIPASGHKPHTRSPLSASSSHQGQASGATSPLKEGSISPVKESASLSSISSASSAAAASLLKSPPLPPSSNGKQPMQGPTMQSHTPPGSPTRGASMHLQMEIDAVDFGTPLPGPMQFNVQIQTSPPGHQGQGQGQSQQQQQQQQQGSSIGKQVERSESPTSPTERRMPVLPSTLLGVGAVSSVVPVRVEGEAGGERMDMGKERERGYEEGESVRGGEGSGQQAELASALSVPAGSSLLVSAEVVPVSSEPQMDENTPLPQQQQQPLYPALIQVEIPPAPQQMPQQMQVEQGQQQQQFGEAAQVFQEQQQSEQQQQQDVQYQQQYAPPPPPQPSYAQWEEPPRLDNERSLWRLACKVRVWDLRRRYSLETIRSLVTHEAHEYYAKHGFPTGYYSRPSSPYGAAGPSMPSGLNAQGLRTPVSQLRAQALRRQVSGGSSSSEGDPTSPVNFMDEEVYDWEIATSDDEEGFIVEEDDEDDEEDYEDVYDDEEEGEEREGEGGEEGASGAASVPVNVNAAEGVVEEKQEGGVEEEKEKAGEKERETSVEIEGESDEERTKRRERRRSSLLRHFRRTSGDSDIARSPSPAIQDDSTMNVEGEGDVADASDMDIEGIDLDNEDLDEALEDPSFNAVLSASTTVSPTSPQQASPASPSPVVSPTAGPSNGVFTSFYVPPVPQVFSPQSLPTAIADPSTSALSAALGTPAEAAASSPATPPSLLLDGDGMDSQPAPPAEPLPPVQIPLQTIAIPMHIPSPPPPIIDMPPPRLSSVPVWALRNMEMSGGNMGKGTPVNRDRATEWGNVWSMDATKSRAVSVMPMGEVTAALMVQKDQDDFSMKVDIRGSGSGSGGKPTLRLSLPGEGDASTSGPAGTSASMGPSGSHEAMSMDGTFEPSNQADWEAFLASLAPPCGSSSSSSSSLMGAQLMMHQGVPDHHQAPPPPYSSHNPNPHHGQQSPPPTPTPPSPASSTSSLHENAAALGGGSMTIHSPGTSQAGNNGMMNAAGMFGMMNVNMMFGMPGSQGGGNGYPQQMQQQSQQQPMQQQQGVNDGGQPSFPAMGLTMQMPPPTMNSMGPQHGSYNNSGMQQSFNSMPFNMGMGMGMNPQTMNMNVPLNMNMGMGVPMSMPVMQMPMSMPFAGLQLGLTVSLSPHQHSAQQHQHHAQQQQQQQQQNQNQWMGGGGVNAGSQGGVPMEYDLGSGMGMGGGQIGEGMFSLVNGTPANTPLNSPLSPSAASIPSSMLGVLGGPSSSGPMSPDSEKGQGAPATSSALSYALG